jgi:hypothetical protein
MSPEPQVTAAGSGPGPLPGADVVLLPLVHDDGTAIYPGATDDLLAELAGAGVTARTWHEPGSFDQVDDRGILTDSLLEIAVGIATSGGWYALQSLLLRRKGTVRVIAVYEQGSQKWRAEVTGSPDEVADTLSRLDPFGADDTPGSDPAA